jgi:solute carrier family 8 (sodium/calcium exchanger)
MILHDRHHGIFSLFESDVSIKETIGVYYLQVIRRGGSRGKVALKYRTEIGTAKPGRDYQHCEGELIFEDGDVE